MPIEPKFAPHVRNPACLRCGGTGYVYLWSVPRVGARVWFCDRSSCKQFWSNESSIDSAVLNNALPVQDFQPLVSTANERERVLQPV